MLETVHIEGIGTGYGKRLRAMGVHTTTDLLKKCTNSNYGKSIAESLKLDAKVIHSWFCMADLLRLEGVDGQFAELLHFSGVQSVSELALLEAKKLAKKMKAINAEQHRVKVTPTKEMVSIWIDDAKTLA